MDEIVKTADKPNWRIYTGTGKPHSSPATIPPPPPWRTFTNNAKSDDPSKGDDPYMQRILAQGAVFEVSEKEVDIVNTALILRRPLLITGKPGTGKSSLAYAVASELGLGPVLRWPITSRTTLADGLYHYDAIGRLQQASLGQGIPNIGQYITLGPLGTAFNSKSKDPRVLLIDEIDKSDIDLPNDLLNIFEEGEFEIRELSRMAKDGEATEVEIFSAKKEKDSIMIREGRVRCQSFPFVVLTSNGEREFPPAFLRRCIPLEMGLPDPERLSKIVKAHLGPEITSQANSLIEAFNKKRDKGYLSVDQLLNAIYLIRHDLDIRDKEDISNAVWRYLSNTGIE